MRLPGRAEHDLTPYFGLVRRNGYTEVNFFSTARGGVLSYCTRCGSDDVPHDVGDMLDALLFWLEELLRTQDTIDSAEKTDVIADPDSSNHFPPDSSYHHRQAQGKESGPRLSRVRPREEASSCRGATPRERWLVPYKDGILYGESWTAREPPRVRGSGPDDERKIGRAHV